jgi:hypothetical protein
MGMIMDKIEILKQIARSDILNKLDMAGIKLYLLLLASAGDKSKGMVDLITIKRTLGFSMERLDLECQRLEELGLVKVASLKHREEKDTKLRYRILPTSPTGGER